MSASHAATSHQAPQPLKFLALLCITDDLFACLVTTFVPVF